MRVLEWFGDLSSTDKFLTLLVALVLGLTLWVTATAVFGDLRGEGGYERGATTSERVCRQFRDDPDFGVEFYAKCIAAVEMEMSE